MNQHEDDEGYDNWEDTQPKRSRKTKFRDADDKEGMVAKRNKRSSKRSHRQKTTKDDFWPDSDD
jgi:hypothetical protein